MGKLWRHCARKLTGVDVLGWQQSVLMEAEVEKVMEDWDSAAHGGGHEEGNARMLGGTGNMAH